MSNGRIFWGVLLVVIGAMFLVDRLQLINLHWSITWKLWPLLLVLWGAAILFGKGKTGPVIAAVGGLGIAVLFFGIVGQAWSWDDGKNDEEENQSDLTQSYDPAVKKAHLTFESGAGTFRIEDSTSDLITASTRSGFGNYKVENVRNNDEESVRVWFEGHNARPWGAKRNTATLRLNANPVWTLDMKIGAAKLDLDLRQQKVERLDIEMGASSARVQMGDGVEHAEVHVQAGASSIDISVPESVGCEVRLETALSSKSLKDFEKTGDNRYRSPNYSSAARTIAINIDGGVSSVKVRRD